MYNQSLESVFVEADLALLSSRTEFLIRSKRVYDTRKKIKSIDALNKKMFMIEMKNSFQTYQFFESDIRYNTLLGISCDLIKSIV